MSARRIPIFQGFYILLQGGRAINKGLEEELVIPAVEQWLKAYNDHPDYVVVQQWLEQKRKQDQEDAKVHERLGQRAAVNDQIDKNFKRFPAGLREVARTAIMEAKGLPPKED